MDYFAWEWIDLDETKQLMDGVTKDESMAADDLAFYDLDKLHFHHQLITLCRHWCTTQQAS
ncbi:hypothetical protein [Moorena sp. SIO3H5]|uniref:hypothetical protein n=1 Tax=Moorena sp. SIO3H5 TaxID=2607834 RepID=UPI0013BC4029|nr:hypothetical protein [Moorena sp. SIO3H5]NEO73554.1 hypothetical protein [Moorena sp. SIO3H5]